MKQNARYRGGSGTGVDLTIPLVDGQQKPRHVDQGEALPTDIGGIAVDPEFVEQLLEQADWEPAAENAEQRAERKRLEHELQAQTDAGEQAAAEHLAAAEQAEAAAIEHRAAADAAAAAAVERVKAEQQLERVKGDQKGATS